jgi:YVTN family beta-propeller protein
MFASRWSRRLGALAGACFFAAASMAQAGSPRRHEAVGFQLFESPQVQPIVLSPDGAELYVAHTTANRVAVLSPALGYQIWHVPVGMDPVSLAIRPGGNELWVSNHVSDSVSVIDIAPGSPTRWRVIDTVQSVDAAGVTRFDEPAGIAFTADGAKAYVALSSTDRIAVIDANARTVSGTIRVRAQEPRAIAVRNGRLYVAAFESGNQSQLSACPSTSPTNRFTSGSPPQCTLGALDLIAFATNPNLPGVVKNIVVDPQLPDRDLFVYDTGSDAEVGVASGVGTLLYGLAVSSAGRVFVTQTDARNVVNGLEGQGLIDLDNRMFDNELAAVTCNPTCGAVAVRNLEASASHASAMATPYGIALSGDDSTLVVTLAGSSRVAAIDAATMNTRSVIDLGAGPQRGLQIPKGVALRSGPAGEPLTAYVLNTMENTVSIVDVSNPDAIVALPGKMGLGPDAMPEAVRRGRVAFHNAFASSSGNFSCASCHPDAHIDQILWRIGGACFFGACTGEDEPRTTMPVRGLKNTLPLHWDGTLGDPFGGPNGAVGNGGSVPASCDPGGPDGDLDCFRHLVDGSLAGVMCDQRSCASGPSGLPGLLTAPERNDLAAYLRAVAYPPARARRMDDTISTPASPVPVPNGDGTASGITANALTGFSDFFTNQGGVADPDTCADSTAGCHTLPLGAATNSQTLAGFDVPTMRGMTDRWVHFSLGITNPRVVMTLANAGINLAGLTAQALEPPIRYDPDHGLREITTFGAAFLIFQPVYAMRPLHSFQMFEEASTGFSGAQGRQVQLNVRTASAPVLATTEAHLAALELADGRGVVNLRGDGVRNGKAITLSFRETGSYRNDDDSVSLTRAELLAEARAGTLILTLTAHLRAQWGPDRSPQPLLAPVGAGSNGVTGDPPLPVIAASSASNPPPIPLVGTDVRTDALLFVDGARVDGTLACTPNGATAFCRNGSLSIDLAGPVSTGLRLLQVQNPVGPLSNEMPICVGTAANCN